MIPVGVRADISSPEAGGFQMVHMLNAKAGSVLGGSGGSEWSGSSVGHPLASLHM